MAAAITWNLKISPKTDQSLRAHLGQRGYKKGDLSKYVEDAVCWRIFEDLLEQARSGFEHLTTAETEQLINQAYDEVKAELKTSDFYRNPPRS